ncbi:MAG: hypothetical protein EAZ43_15220 [Betaproteobacteria bacterium]|nr:MAG: hypothetical protein EAZ43_15220 [Betaproteobacteria bacterium]
MLLPPLRCLFAILLPVMLSYSAANAQPQNPPNNRLLIGAVLSVSSHQGGAGVSFARGASAAVKAANAAGGLNGRSVSLQVENDEGSSATAAELTAELAKSGALAVLGGSGEAAVGSMAATAKRTRLALVGGLSCSPQQRIALSDVLVTARLPDSETSKAVARNLGDLNRRRVVVLSERDLASVARAQVYLKALQSLGGFELKHVKIGEQAVEGASALPEIVEFRPTAVLLLVGYEATADLIKKSRLASHAFHYYVTSDIGTASLKDLLGNGVKGVTLLSTTPIASDSKSAIVRQFRVDMSAHAAGATMDELALEGYMSARLVLDAIRRSGRSPSSDQVRRVLMSEPTVLGEITFRQTSVGTTLNIQPELAIFSADGRLLY